MRDHHQSRKKAMALAMAVGALATAPAGTAGAEPDRTVPVRIVELERDPGFNWGDAGIGAAGAIALAAIGTGGVVAARSRASDR